jgi:protein phosphatase
MQNTLATLYCPNPNCQTPNLEENTFCQRCRTSLPKRYLWAVGSGVAAYSIGDTLAARYLFKGNRVLLDTQPGLPLEHQAEIPEAVEPYLKLFPYRLHIPQVYDLVPLDQGPSSEKILLLEQAPISARDLPRSTATAYPAITQEKAQIGSAIILEQAWPQASPLRQLYWLWQIAQLWQPLSSQGVAASLLQPQLLRVEGPWVRLLELSSDWSGELSLAELGQFWLSWIPQAQAVITPALEQLCQQMIAGQVQTAEHLVTQLDQWLEICGRSQTVQIDIATRTDQGPSRQRNEDACYPPDGTLDINSIEALTIVCDGVGGHAGGDIASSLAIATLQQHLARVQPSSLPSRQLILELEVAACAANDLISQRNDEEHRQERQRMGTTLVMALARAHEMYITHIGDSRVYWINQAGCYQVTLDDDVASREVRLGYAPYREALRQPAAGSLIQALGMGSSAILRPTVQRFILDEDCIFLLCSDGLSDYDRVEEVWQTAILPILDGQIDLATASKQLIDLANLKNGHDNVTVGLVYCHVAPAKGGDQLSPESFSLMTFASPETENSLTETQLLQSSKVPRRSATVSLLLSGLSLGLLGLLAYLVFPVIPWLNRPKAASEPKSTDLSTLSSPPPISLSTSNPRVGTFLQIQPSTTDAQTSTSLKSSESLFLLRQPGATAATQGTLLAGNILQVLRRQTLPGQESWLQVKVCSVPLESSTSEPPAPAPPSTAKNSASATSPASRDVSRPLASPKSSATPAIAAASPTSQLTTRPVKPGVIGWIQEEVITVAAIEPKLNQLSANQLRACTANPSTASGKR